MLVSVAMPSSRGSSQCRDRTCISCMAVGFFTTEPPGRPKIRLADDSFQKVFSSSFSDMLFFDHWTEQDYKELCLYREEDS